MDKVMFKEQKSFVNLKRSHFSTPLLVSVLIQFGLIILSGFLIFNSVRSFQIARDKIAILNRANDEVTDLRLKNISLILEKGSIETDDFTETDIRNRLNYSKKGEVLFVLSDQSLELSRIEVDSILSNRVSDIENIPVWKQWYDLFVNGV